MTQSRLQRRLLEIDGIQSTRREAQSNAAVVDQQIDASGKDVFELAARVALGAWEARGAHAALNDVGANDAYAIGYRTAAAELATVLRAMRRGTPPSPEELATLEIAIRKEYSADGI